MERILESLEQARKEIFMPEKETGGYQSDDVEESLNSYVNHYVVSEYHSNFFESVAEAIVNFLRNENRPCANMDIHDMMMSIEENIDYLLEDRGKWLAFRRRS